MDPKLNQSLSRRSGVALILVIGMLALMMVLGVSFSIFMRSERAAAGNFRADVQNRELLQVALGRALDQIEGSVGGNMYPPWDVQTSGGSEVYSNALSGSITNWIPQGVFVETPPSNVKPGWIQIPVQGSQVKKVAYVILNCSGLLDANFAGGATRGCGASPLEMELNEIADKAGFVAARPYETEQELNVRGLLSGPADVLVTYSAFPNSYDGGTNRNLADISGGTASLNNNKTNIVSAFIASVDGASAADGEFFFNNLCDYVDEDDVSSNLGSPSTESVPMINEVRARAFLGDVDTVGKTCLSAVEIEVEWYYPFLKSPSGNYKMFVDVVVSNTGGAASAKYIPTTAQLQFSNLACGPGLVKAEAAESPFSVNVAGCATTDVVSLTAYIGIQIKNGNNQVVDSVPYPYQQNKYFKIDFPSMVFPSIAPADLVGGEWHGFECFDPRFNWETTEDYWYKYPDADGIVVDGSMGVTNKIVTQLRANSPTEYDSFSGMYVANAPLQNVGELSYLLRSADLNKTPFWNTLKLWADQRLWPLDRVLDHFVVGSNQVRRGLLNVNSQSTSAWASIFYEMPKDAYPGEPGAGKVTMSEANAMAEVMVSFAAVPLSSLSNVGMATNLYEAAGLAGSSPLRQRSVFRNISSLLDIRQQYFTVLLYGAPISTKDSGEVATVQAIAEVWRDPLPRTDGTHPKFVRSLVILDRK